MTRVLIIDDDPSIRQLVEYALDDEGYQVDQAPDGKAALDLIGRRHPDIIILDIRMPGMDGWEFARAYRERYDHPAPIIVLSASHGTSHQGTDVEGEGYVAKPFELDALIEQVYAIANKTGPV